MADDVEIKFGTESAGVTTGVRQVANQLDQLLGPIKSLQSAFNAVRDTIVAAFAVREIEEFVEHVTAMNAELERSAAMLGVTVKQAA
jgi:cell division protein ZapA (FtsZ GTPase activity inhibitor)